MGFAVLLVVLAAALWAWPQHAESRRVEQAWLSFSQQSPSHAFVHHHFRPCIEALVTQPKFVSAGTAELCSKLTNNAAAVLQAPADVAPAVEDWIAARKSFGYL